MFIRGKSLGAVWVAYLTHIINTGTFVSDDKEPIIETPPICLEITNISYDDPIIKAFGSERVIEMYVRKMFSKEIIQELNSTYGDRIFDNQGVDQFEWMVARLKKKWWAKSAVIGLIKPNDPGPRIPCLISLQTTICKNLHNREWDISIAKCISKLRKCFWHLRDTAPFGTETRCTARQCENVRHLSAYIRIGYQCCTRNNSRIPAVRDSCDQRRGNGRLGQWQ